MTLSREQTIYIFFFVESKKQQLKIVPELVREHNVTETLKSISLEVNACGRKYCPKW